MYKGKFAGRTRGVGGSEKVYFHDITIGVVFGKSFYEFTSEVTFSKNLDFGLLGRKGFFDLFDEISFRQDARKCRFRGEGSRLLKKSDFQL